MTTPGTSTYGPPVSGLIPQPGGGWVNTTTGQGYSPGSGYYTFTPGLTGSNLSNLLGAISTMGDDFFGAAPNGAGGAGGKAGGGTAGGGTTAGGSTGPGAKAYIQNLMSQYGLESLTDWAYDLLVKGYSEQYIMAELRNQQAFKDRFPAIALRQAAGLPPLSPQEYVDMERSYDGFMRASGLDNFFDRKDLYTKWIAGEVSPAEAKARADEAYAAVQGEPVETRAEFQRMFGIGAGAAAVAYFLNPETSFQKIKEQFSQAQIGGASIRSTYGLLSTEEAQRLQQLGITVDQASTGFGDLVHKRELLDLLPGEAGTSISRDAALGAEFGGDAAAQQQITDIASRRKAAVQGGGQYRRTRTGVGGLGSSTN